MQKSREEELKQVQKKLLVLCMIDMPAAIVVGLGLFAVMRRQWQCHTCPAE